VRRGRLAELHVQREVALEPVALSAQTGHGEAARRLDVTSREAIREKEPTVFVGVDWACLEHQVCLVGPAGPVQWAVAHEADSLGAMMDWLMASASDPQDVAVAIEVPHGPVVEALMDRGFAFYAINLKQLATPRSWIASVAGSRPPEPGTIDVTPSCSLLRPGPTVTALGAGKRSIRLSSTCASGREWRMNAKTSATD
jgi:hypothetical protein